MAKQHFPPRFRVPAPFLSDITISILPVVLLPLRPSSVQNRELGLSVFSPYLFHLRFLSAPDENFNGVSISSLSIGREGGEKQMDPAPNFPHQNLPYILPCPKGEQSMNSQRLKKHFSYICTPIFVSYACLLFFISQSSFPFSILEISANVCPFQSLYHSPFHLFLRSFSPFPLSSPFLFFCTIRSQQHLGSEREVGITENQTQSPFKRLYSTYDMTSWFFQVGKRETYKKGVPAKKSKRERLSRMWGFEGRGERSFFRHPNPKRSLRCNQEAEGGGISSLLFLLLPLSHMPRGTFRSKEEEDTKRAGEKKCWEISNFSKLAHDFF